MRKILSAFVLCTGICAHLAYADSVVIGASNGNPNVFPFSNIYSGEYQQAYGATSFSGTVLITAITFFEAPQYTGLLTGNFTLKLSATTAAINALSTNYASNFGPTSALFASGTFASSGATNTLTFAAANPFRFDPAQGNLLVDITNNSSSGGAIAFLAGVSLDTSRVYNFGGTGTPTADAMGLQTSFTYTNATAVTPEPSSLLLLGTGSAAILGLARRRVMRPRI